MPAPAADPPRRDAEDRLFSTLKRLLALEVTTVEATLAGAADLVARVLAADKVDVFLFEPGSESLVAVGVSDTPMARKQRAIGLDRLPLANGGRVVDVFRGGEPYRCGDVQADPGELVGVREGLGIHSEVSVRMMIEGRARGVLSVTSAARDAFDAADLQFVVAVAHWIGVAAHRAELVETLALQAEQAGRQTAAEELILVVSHDLRNLLLPLGLRLQTLAQRAGRDGRADDLADLDRLQDNVRRLDQLVRDLLDMERLERGLFAASPARVDLAALARGTAELLAVPGAPIHVDAPDALPVEADALALRQALENLLANARKHSPAGAPVFVRIAEDGTPPRAVVQVRDTGAGIAAELLPRLFHRFARGPDSAGLGLGLYLARRLVEAQSGSLRVERSDGPGACFCIELPLRRAPVDAKI
jgi:two-component system, OmpR family, sensor kinase